MRRQYQVRLAQLSSSNSPPTSTSFWPTLLFSRGQRQALLRQTQASLRLAPLFIPLLHRSLSHRALAMMTALALTTTLASLTILQPPNVLRTNRGLRPTMWPTPARTRRFYCLSPPASVTVSYPTFPSSHFRALATSPRGCRALQPPPQEDGGMQRWAAQALALPSRPRLECPTASQTRLAPCPCTTDSRGPSLPCPPCSAPTQTPC